MLYLLLFNSYYQTTDVYAFMEDQRLMANAKNAHSMQKCIKCSNYSNFNNVTVFSG